MKYKISLLLLLLLYGTFLCGCKEKSSDDPTPAMTFMSATVDGQNFSVTGTGSLGNTNGTSGAFQLDNQTLYLTGVSPTVNLSMTVKGFPRKAGTYNLTLADNTGTYVDAKDATKPVIYLIQRNKPATLVISAFDGKALEGTFSYTSYNNSLKKEITVSGGTFKVVYEEF